MKKQCVLFLILIMVLMLTACGAAESPMEATEIPMEATEIPTENYMEVFEDSPVEQELKDGTTQVLVSENYHDFQSVLYKMGFVEFHVEYYKTSLNSTNWPSVLRELTYDDDSFRLILDYENYDDATGTTEMIEGWILYGTKADGIENISGIKPENYGYYDEFDRYAQFPEQDEGYRDWIEYTYCDPGMVFCYAFYYPETGNLYNLVKVFEEYPTGSLTFPRMLLEHKEDESGRNTLIKETVEVDGYSMEMAEFTLHWGENSKTYQFRVGMSLADWAASELNTDGWVNGFEGAIYSPDYQYIVYCQLPDITYAIDFYNNIYAVENVPEVSLRASSVELMEWGMGANVIHTATAHLVNWQTPLLTNGFKIRGQYEGRSDYNMFDLGGNFIAGENLTIYMNNVDSSLLPDIKLYIFKESQELVDMIGENSFGSHILPLPADDPMLTIPENATCLTFEKADPNRDEIFYMDKNVVVARYNMANDPNFSPEGENVYAITYQDKLVYWIHVPEYDSGFLYQDMVNMGDMSDKDKERLDLKIRRAEIMNDLYNRTMVAQQNYFQNG